MFSRTPRKKYTDKLVKLKYLEKRELKDAFVIFI